MCAQPCASVDLSSLSLEELLVITEECLSSVAEQALSWNECGRLEGPVDPPENGITALMQLVSDKQSFQFSIASTEAECETMTRALFMIGDDEEFPDDIDTADALCEIANIVAGELKKRFHEQDDSFRLGIPVILKGTVTCCCRPGQHMEMSKYKIGPINVLVTVILGLAGCKGK